MTFRACEVCGGSAFRHLFTKSGHEFYRCRSCRLGRIDPQPTDDVLARIYSRHYFDAWGVPTGADRVWQLKKDTFRLHVLNAVALKRGARVLDCGAAFGALMAAVAELGSEPYGIELVEEAAAEIARRFGPDRVFTGPFEQASLADLGDDAFAVVFMCDFIEHMRDPLATLKKAASLLRPGGSVVITTPDTGASSHLLMGAAWPHYHLEHLWYFNQRNLAKLLHRAGFTVTFSGPARKVIDLAYLSHHLNARQRPLIAPAVNLLARCAGARLRNRPWSFSLGQMLVTATHEGPDSSLV